MKTPNAGAGAPKRQPAAAMPCHEAPAGGALGEMPLQRLPSQADIDHSPRMRAQRSVLQRLSARAGKLVFDVDVDAALKRVRALVLTEAAAARRLAEST
jgi:hypothetical protein